jgi:hypothetical protein
MSPRAIPRKAPARPILDNCPDIITLTPDKNFRNQDGYRSEVDKHSARLGNHTPRAEPECAYLQNEPDEKKLMAGSRLNTGV